MNLFNALILAAALISSSPAPAEPSKKATPFLPITNEAPPELHVEQPLPGPLAARGAVIVPYRTENIRILPVFGPGAKAVSPRAGHLHVTVDDLPWHWADAAGDDTIVVVGLPAGPHKLLIELADPEHKVITGRTVAFVVPPTAGHGH